MGLHNHHVEQGYAITTSQGQQLARVSEEFEKSLPFAHPLF